ncbi:MAG TPA: O-antigen ligase family protein [Acidimicrobiales bacterium]
MSERLAIRSRPRHRYPPSPWLVVFAGAAALVQFSVALAAARRPGEALVIVAATATLVAAVAFPRIVLVVSLLATMFPQRVGPEALNLSVTDAVGLLGLVAALRFVPWHDRRLRLVYGALVIYLGCIAVSLIAHHPQRAVLELFHRGVLFGGAVLIGVALVRSGSSRLALRVFALATAVVSIAAIVSTVTNGFEPAFVFDLQKNHAGVLVATGFLVVYVGAHQIAWSPRVTNSLRVLTLLGLAATQSRAAALGLVAAIAIRPLLLGRRGAVARVSTGIVVVCVALVALSAVSVNANDLSRPADEQKFNSINSRTSAYEQAIGEVWAKNRIVGGGLRYFRTPGGGYVTPHNLVVGEMAEAGLIGLFGLLVLLTATALALRRSVGDLAVLGMMALVLRVTQGLADIFWVAGPLTAPLILVGMGVADRRAEPRQGWNRKGRVASASIAAGGDSPVSTSRVPSAEGVPGEGRQW